MTFALTGEQIAIRDMARDFARARIEPHALDWDEQKFTKVSSVSTILTCCTTLILLPFLRHHDVPTALKSLLRKSDQFLCMKQIMVE